MDRCSYCHKEMYLSSRHEPNCDLNPYFQNRFYQLPREYLIEIIPTSKSDKQEVINNAS